MSETNTQKQESKSIVLEESSTRLLRLNLFKEIASGYRKYGKNKGIKKEFKEMGY